MEDIKTDDTKSESTKLSRGKGHGIGVSYPIETVETMVEFTKNVISEHGSSRPITKEEIAKALNKQINSLSLFFSTMSQYGLFSVVHGKGYLPTDLYRKYIEPVHDNDEYKAKLSMFQAVPLYAKIIERLNGHQLPADDKRFANLLKGDPYNVNPNSSEKAAKVFFDNCRNLNLRDNSGKFKFPDLNEELTQTTRVNNNQQHNDINHPPPPDSILIKLPIHLPGEGNRIAYFEYPKILNKRDFKVIAKALTYVASGLVSDSENEDYELKIAVLEEGVEPKK